MKDDIFTTNDIAQLLSVDISTVIDWIDRGRLPAYRTPGGHRRVKRADLLSFIQNHKLPFPEELSRPQKIVLIVEDDKDFRRLLKGYVEEAALPVSIHEAEDGFMAGKLVEELKPDLVILDLFLPGINGFQVCEHIRKDPDLSDTRIVAISGKGSKENKEQILQAGADAFLSKPFGFQAFKDILEKSLSGTKVKGG